MVQAMRFRLRGKTSYSQAIVAMESISTPEKTTVPLSAQPSRAQLVDLIMALLAKQNKAEAEITRRAAEGKGIAVRGTMVDVGVLREAIERHQEKQKIVAATPAPLAVCGKASTGRPRAGNDPRAGRTPHAHDANAGLRANAKDVLPAGVAKLLSKALQECETAEPFCCKVSNLSGKPIPILPKPSVLSSPIEFLAPGQAVAVIARSLSAKDGRVYLRLRKREGWVSTRSAADFTQRVLTTIDTDAPALEPPEACASAIAEYSVMEILPHLDAAAQEVAHEEDGGELPKYGPLMFRATGRCQVLSAPLLSSAPRGAMLKEGEGFVADGVHLNRAEGRCYLWAQDRLGWVCERRRHEFSALAVELGCADEKAPGGRRAATSSSKDVRPDSIESVPVVLDLRERLRRARARMQGGGNEDSTPPSKKAKLG